MSVPSGRLHMRGVGATLDHSFGVLRPGGVLVSSVALPDQEKAAQCRVREVFFLVAVTTEGLARIAELLDAGRLTTNVGEVLPLASARLAHEMLAGKPHQGGIVLAVDGCRMVNTRRDKGDFP